jgi:hypothetical protein
MTYCRLLSEGVCWLVWGARGLVGGVGLGRGGVSGRVRWAQCCGSVLLLATQREMIAGFAGYRRGCAVDRSIE